MPIPSGYTSGQVVQAVPVPSNQFAIFNEQQATNTNGGDFTSGSYVKRILNTTIINTISGCTLTSSVISLPAGTYNATAYAPAYSINGHRIRLQNTTASTTIVLGVNCFANHSSPATTHSFLNATFTLSATSNIELQHRCETTRTVNGLGTLCNFGDNEVYAQIQIEKVA
jgi:hypothetical protein